MPAHRKENPVRRNLPPQYTALPAEGRQGKTPAWPLPKLEVPGLKDDPEGRAIIKAAEAAERALWTQLWKIPQAVMWERLGYNRIVARYVRHLLIVEGFEPSTRLLAEVRALEDRLGLTPKAMESLRWRVVVDEVSEARAASSNAQERTAVARQRLQAVDSSAVV